MSPQRTYSPGLETFPKLPLGGIDRRSLADVMTQHGLETARADLATNRAQVTKHGVAVAADTCVLLLGGSNGILRAVGIQLVFGERVPIACVHYDSERLQIGVHHAQAITEAAEREGVSASFRNGDATQPKVIAEVVAALKLKYRAVHLINGIAAGATKRYQQHGPTKVPDLDVAFDAVRQIPDFTRWESVRRIGLVDVEVATQADIDRTNKMMGTSSALWVDALADAGLIARGESIVAFADYDYEPDDPVYALGPLAGAKLLQRESMRVLAGKYGVRTARLCYPAMNTTAIGAIPGGTLMFAGSAQVLIERGRYRNLAALARETMPLFAKGFAQDELRLDDDYREALPAFHQLASELTNANLRERLGRVVGHVGL